MLIGFSPREKPYCFCTVRFQPNQPSGYKHSHDGFGKDSDAFNACSLPGFCFSFVLSFFLSLLLSVSFSHSSFLSCSLRRLRKAAEDPRIFKPVFKPRKHENQETSRTEPLNHAILPCRMAPLTIRLPSCARVLEGVDSHPVGSTVSDHGGGDLVGDMGIYENKGPLVFQLRFPETAPLLVCQPHGLLNPKP